MASLSAQLHPSARLQQPTDSVLRFENVTVQFDGEAALDGVSFDIRRGQTRVILGAAASGKTVLLKTALGLAKPDAGRVFLFDQDITDLDETALFDIRERVGMLFQESALFDSMTVEENVAYPFVSRLGSSHPLLDWVKRITKRNGVKAPAAPSEKEISERVREALRFVELEHTLEKFPSELSGGMRRRVGIARATVTQPDLVLYDSPTAGLDPITANTIMALIVKERDLRGTTTALVTHRYQDGELVAKYRYNRQSERLEHAGEDASGKLAIFMVLKEGRLVFEGTQGELESSKDAYLSKFVLKARNQ